MENSNQQSDYSALKNSAFEEWRNLFSKAKEYSSNKNTSIAAKSKSNLPYRKYGSLDGLNSTSLTNTSNKTPEKENRYHRKFMEKLIANSKTKNPLQEWKYVGGNSGRHARWYQNLYPDCSCPPSKNVCICSHPIIENCYIQNIHTDSILIVGNCCIKRFLPLENQGRSCPKCKEPHRNRNDPWCDDCRGGILTVGSHKGRSYRWILERKPNYGRFILSISARGDLAKLSNWLRENDLTSKDQTTRRVLGKKVYKKKVNKKKQNIRRISPLPMKTKNSFRNDQMKHIQEANNQKLQFGQYGQRTYKWVIDNDPKYCEWVSKMEFPGWRMAKFQSWLRLSNRRN